MASFKSACLRMLQHEGGYSNRPDADYGGETYMGISRRWHPAWPGWPEIDRIKAMRDIKHNEMSLVDLDLVMHFYRDEFWSKMKGDQIVDHVVASHIFDHGVTSGLADAVRMAQIAAGCRADGVLGPKTLAALNDLASEDKYNYRVKLFKFRICYYMTEADKSLVQAANLPSWVRRTLKTHTGEA